MSDGFDQLLLVLEQHDKKYDLEQIKRAYVCAKEQHLGQMRKSGDPYITHPITVAMILAELGMDSDCIVAALLHDVVEDTPFTLDQVRQDFGASVAQLVDGLTKLKQFPLQKKDYHSLKQQQAENIRKMLLAMSQDIRVILIKLADRLHNMRTLDVTSPDKQRRVSLETMEIYAPIAHRLGISSLKQELENLSIRYLDPMAVAEIEKRLDEQHLDRMALIQSLTKRIAERLTDYKMDPPVIQGRVKSLYSIYRKVYMTGREFEEIYDIFAVRVIVNTDIECYNVLGVIHDMFHPIPKRFKDYISTPKPNMYQSLHTTVIGQDGVPFEIQIRTWEMHRVAEYGIAAHWKYKQGVQGKDSLEERLTWIRQIIESQDTEEDIVQTIKSDLAPEEVYAFTPSGEVKCLPTGATVVDFAYHIHSEIGHKMIGAKVDGRIVSLEHQIKNGQIIEIMTTKSPTHGPNKAWLNIAKTSEARSKIRGWFKKERREENIIEGKMEFERELARNYIQYTPEQYEQTLKRLCRRYNHDESDFFAAIGYGGISLSRIIPPLKEEYLKLVKAKEEEERWSTPTTSMITLPEKISGDIVVEGIDNCVIKYAKCCAPLPGDDIIGFISRGHGVSVHKSDCVNVLGALSDPEKKDRFIKVDWARQQEQHYFCTLDIVARDREKLFSDVSLALCSMRIPLHEISARTLKNGNAIIVVTISLQGVEHLQKTMQKLEKIAGVLSVERSGK